MPIVAILDACVLYPAPLRDLLLSLAQTGVYLPKWTTQIHREWTQSVLRRRPDISQNALDRTIELMNRSVEECLIDDYEGLIDLFQLPDPDDRHILAAAIHGQAQVIVTRNIRDFPSRVLSKYGVTAKKPDDFLSELFDLNFLEFCSAVFEQRQRLKNPHYSQAQLLEIFEKQGLSMTVKKLTKFIDLI